MQRDFKIGLTVGVVFVAAAGLWLATRPSMSPEARLQQPRTEESGLQPPEEAQAAQDVREAALRQLLPGPADESAGGGPGRTAGAGPQPADSSTYAAPQKPKTQRSYVVREGDNLSTVSQLYYGSPNKWRVIFDANRRTIKDPDKIQPGMRLIIPE